MACKGGKNKSFFADIESAKAIEVFELTRCFNEDNDKNKVNLGVGAYRTDDGKPWVLPVVKTVEAQMAADNTLNHEYLAIRGMKNFSEAGIRLLLGKDSPAILENRVEGFQALGGTGAIRLCAEFCKKQLGYDNMIVSDPTWGNHNGVFKACGFSNIQKYRYWNPETRSIDFDGMLEDIRAMPEKTVLILHGCCHNPTGVNPTEEQWKQIIDLVKEKNLLVLLDEAYQGFASGNLEEDGSPARYLVQRGLEFFISQSFSKNFGLYNERTGNLIVVAADKESKAQLNSQMEMIIRTTWSNPPNHGARIVATVLDNEACNSEWKEHVKTMASRIMSMREMLYTHLKKKGTPGSWDHITSQKGMFSYTGLSPDQVAFIKEHYHIYMLQSGRINMCALTSRNIEYVAKAIDEAVRQSKL